MCQLAYSVGDAAKAAGVSEQDIKDALKAKELTAREAGKSVVITAADIGTWLLGRPVWGDA